jgi:predicted metal-dependent peptidase
MAISDDRVRSFKDDLETILCKYSIEFPFWGVLSERCKFGLTETYVPTACMDKFGNITFNINFVEGLKEKYQDKYHKKLLFLLSHEISHFIFEHASRLEDRDPYLFNVACDYAINLLLHYQFESNNDYFIEGGCLDEKYKDMTAEAIYEIIKQDDKFKKDPIYIDVIFDDGSGEGEGEGSGDGEGDEKDGEGKGKGGTITIRDRRVPLPSTEGKSKEQVASDIKDHIMRAFTEAYAVAKSQGKLPADFERAIARILKPKVDWLRALRNKLRYGVSRMEKRDITWNIPNKRFLGKDFILPSNIGPESPKVAYAVDTSGSMSQRDLEQAMSELEDIRKRFNAKVYVLDCDADVHGSGWITPQQPLPVLNGGGGTDFRPVFEHLAEERIKPDYCVFFTDGYGEFGDVRPPYPVLWVMTSDVKPPFGETIQVNVPYDE